MADTIHDLIERLNKRKSVGDWQGIYKQFQPIEELHQNELIWNNHKVLNDVALACAKLSETGAIPRDIFRDSVAKTKFLEQQAEYRKHTEQIRKRCIKLKPNNSGYRSNLAFTYYQNINELTSQSSRKDGNIRAEIDNFITAVEEALTLDPTRVTDMYRKGRILVKVLPDQILWSKSYEDFGHSAEKLKKVYEIREKGIQTLRKAINEWEKLDPHNPNEESTKKRYRKDYIKSLYTLSRTSYDKIVNDWDESVYALNLCDDVLTNQQVAINQDDMQNIEDAIQTIKKCCKTDCSPKLLQDVKQNQQRIETIAAVSGVYEGVDKLYRIGKIFFAKYWILSDYGSKDTDSALEARQYAEHYLQASLKCEWSPQKSKQDKSYIAERLARVFISKGEYDQAISIIESYHEDKLKYRGNLESIDEYILHTWALAMFKSRRITETQTILDIAKKSRNKKELWKTYFLKGCAYLEADELERAQENLMCAYQEAERVGKRNLDSLFIAKAFVSYKSGKVPDAMKYLKEAQKLNPYRRTISERIQKWQQNDNYST